MARVTQKDLAGTRAPAKHPVRKEQELVSFRLQNWRFRRMDQKQSEWFVDAMLRDVRNLLLAGQGASQAAAALSASGQPPECPVTEIRFMWCEIDGIEQWCRCELHECADGSSYWTCTPAAG